MNLKSAPLIGNHAEHYRNAHIPCGYAVPASTVLCPECKDGRLVKGRRRVEVMNLRTRVKMKNVIEFLKCRKCGCSFTVYSDMPSELAIPGDEYAILGSAKVKP